MTIKNFDQLLLKYAHLLIDHGLAIKEDDYLTINANIEIAPFVRLLVARAYENKAKKVIVKWNDDTISRLDYLNQSEETLTDIPQYRIDESLDLIDKRAKRLSIHSANPNALDGVDPKKIAAAQLAGSKAFKEQRLATQANVVSWLVAAAGGLEWAQLVFPDLESDAALDALWHEIFLANRVYEEDPITAWKAHEKSLVSRANYLNDQQFDRLHYTGPGTDLTLGLPKNHVWEAAGSKNQQGEYFVANMPTEEVFTAPDNRRADGVITSSKPLSYGGVVIDKMTFHFEHGKIIKATAEQGEETLKQLIESNDGAKQLGEVALVPHQSPISQSGIIFFNTLFDENASNHLAIGQAYATCVRGGEKMTQEELHEAGLNRSTVHVDFMVGNGEMDIDGIKEDGTVVPIFRKGEWAF